MKTLAIIGASYLQLPLAKKAKEMGLRTICFAWAEGAVCKEEVDAFYPISIVEKEQILEICKQEQIAGICTIASDVAAPTVAYVAEQMGLVGNNYECALRANNKYLMRQAFTKAGVPCPQYWCLTNLSTLNITHYTSHLPLIVKPSDRSGSLGVTKVEKEEDLIPAIKAAQEYSFKHEAMVEQFIEGREISVEFISYNGVHYPLQITDKVTTEAPHFVELAHHQPADLTREQYEEIYELTKRALTALGVTNGASHSEYRITKEGKIFVMEIGARMGGDFIGAAMVQLSTGYDFVKGVIEVALGEFKEPVFGEPKYSGVLFVSEETKQLMPVLENWQQYPELLAGEITRPGLRTIECSGDRTGYVIYQADHKIDASHFEKKLITDNRRLISQMSNLHNDIFLRSALTMENPYNSTEQVLDWIREQNRKILVNVRQISFKEMEPMWQFDTEGNLRHASGKFFSIEGIRVKTNYGNVAEWEQPIINQPEIGYLGIITKEIDGVLYFLLQAKVEPGNVNNVQLSPTLQATKSNYSQVHKGNKPLYLEYFQNAKPEQILLDQLQSEQGARFLRKRNRNIIIKVEEEIPVYDNFIWVTLGQIKALASMNNVVNMDTRTVISGIPLHAVADMELPQQKAWGYDLLHDANPYHTTTEILSWMTSLKCKYELNVTPIPLKDVGHWRTTDMAIEHEAGRFFKVIAAQVEINNREVKTWCQPLVAPAQQGLTAFVIKKINGTYHFLVQGKVESGNFDTLEMAPTVQCITDNYTGKNNQPFVEYVLNARKEQIRVDTLQSEEGGRFYQEQNRNLIIEADDSFPVDNLPENYIWVSFQQLMLFLQFNNYLNIQSRSLISLIRMI